MAVIWTGLPRYADVADGVSVAIVPIERHVDTGAQLDGRSKISCRRATSQRPNA